MLSEIHDPSGVVRRYLRLDVTPCAIEPSATEVKRTEPDLEQAAQPAEADARSHSTLSDLTARSVVSPKVAGRGTGPAPTLCMLKLNSRLILITAAFGVLPGAARAGRFSDLRRIKRAGLISVYRAERDRQWQAKGYSVPTATERVNGAIRLTGGLALASAISAGGGALAGSTLFTLFAARNPNEATQLGALVGTAIVAVPAAYYLAKDAWRTLRDARDVRARAYGLVLARHGLTHLR